MAPNMASSRIAARATNPLWAAFSAAVWASSYVILPAAKLYDPIWKYDRKTLANDLRAHLVYGLNTATALQMPSR